MVPHFYLLPLALKHTPDLIFSLCACVLMFNLIFCFFCKSLYSYMIFYTCCVVVNECWCHFCCPQYFPSPLKPSYLHSRLSHYYLIFNDIPCIPWALSLAYSPQFITNLLIISCVQYHLVLGAGCSLPRHRARCPGHLCYIILLNLLRRPITP